MRKPMNTYGRKSTTASLTAENLFAIQSEISGMIASALEATLSPREQQAISNRPTENLAAYNAYLLGRQLMARRGIEDLTRAQQEFQRATELDPGFAMAWVGVAETAYLLWGNTRLSFPETMSMSRRLCEQSPCNQPSTG